MNRIKIALLALVLTACTSQQATHTAPEAMPLNVQSTMMAVKLTEFVSLQAEVAKATEERRITEQAIADAQTATAYPLALQQTQAAATATALPMVITQAAIIDAATLGAVQTKQANAQATSTAYAGVYVGMTATAEAIEDYRAQRAGEWWGNIGGGLFQFALAMFAFVVLCVMAWMSVLFGVYLSNRVHAPRVIDGQVYLPAGSTWRQAPPPQLVVPASSSQPEPAKPAPAQPYAEEWRAFWLSVVTLSAGWGGSLAYRQRFENVIESGDKLGDWQTCIREPFITAGLAVPVNTSSGKTLEWASGWSAAKAKDWLYSYLPPLPYPGTPPTLREQTTSGNSVKQEAGGV